MAARRQRGFAFGDAERRRGDRVQLPAAVPRAVPLVRALLAARRLPLRGDLRAQHRLLPHRRRVIEGDEPGEKAKFRDQEDL